MVANKKLRDMNDKVFFTIQLCLSNETLQEVLSENTAKGLWEELKDIYMNKSLTNRLWLKLRIYTLRMDKGTYICDHLVKFTPILNDLAKLGVTVEDEDQALLLLCSLPASYKLFRDLMVYSRERITLEDVKNNLRTMLHLDNEMTNIEKGSSIAGLFVDRSRPNEINPVDRRTRNENITCYYYKKKGYIKANCLKLKNKQVADKGVSSNATIVADVDECECF
jgi:gag-polypeptide of LTR copia-type